MGDGSTEQKPAVLETGSPCLQGERVTFTGTLASMTHQQAYRLVEEHGGVPLTHVSRQLTMLVIGEEGWPLEEDGQPSQKLQQANRRRQEGCPIRLLNESEWLHLLGLSERHRDVHRLYTPAMLSQLLDVPVGTIRRWERMGLIKPVRKVYRLPYFDFQEVTGARRIAELLDAGLSPAKIESGLQKLDALLQGTGRPLAQLDFLVRGTRLLYRDANGLLEPKTGQRCFDFEPPSDGGGITLHDESASSVSLPDSKLETEEPVENDSRVDWSVDEWFHEGCRLLDEHLEQQAVEAFRLCLLERPGDAETSFFLAEALYRLGNTAGAMERYYAAVEADREYIEGWTQIGCIHAEQGESQAALEAFNIALDVHPDYPEAHLHTAEVLHQLGNTGEAVPHWKTYLQHIDRGPWAETARQRLEEAESKQTTD